MPTVQEIINASVESAVTTPELDLSRGLAQTIYEKGGADFYAALKMKPMEGNPHQIAVEAGEPLGSSVRSTITRNVAKSNARLAKVFVPMGVLLRDVETPAAQIRNMQRSWDFRKGNVRPNIKKLAKDHLTQAFGGTGNGDNMKGMAHWLECYAGVQKADGTVWYPRDSAELTYVKRPQAKFIHRNGTAGNYAGAANLLNLAALNAFHEQADGEPFTQNVVDGKTFLALQAILDTLPGNSMSGMKESDAGRSIVVIKGHRYYHYDVLDRNKLTTRASVSADGLTITIDAPEPDEVLERWIGLTDRDLGAKVKLYKDAYAVNDQDTKGGFTGGTATTTNSVIANLATDATYWRKFTVDVAVDAAFRGLSNLGLVVEPTPFIQSFFSDEEDGFAALYSGATMEGDGAAEADPNYARIAGFLHRDAGFTQTGGRFYLDQLDWWGNFGCARPAALATLQGFRTV